MTADDRSDRRANSSKGQGEKTVPARTGPAAKAVGLCATAIRWWALAGGLVMTGLAVMTALSAVSNVLFQAPFPADYELVKHFVAVAIFMFLPYCQLVGSNVTVDLFTEKMSTAKKAAMASFSALFAVAFAALLLRQMAFGMESYLRYPEVTPVLGLPLWTAFPPILLSLVLLLVAAVVSLLDGVAGMRGRPPWFEHRPTMPIE